MTGLETLSPPKIRFSILGEAWNLLVKRFWLWLLLSVVYNVGNYAVGRTQVPLAAWGLLPYQPASFPLHHVVAWFVVCCYAAALAVVNAFFCVGLYRAAAKQVVGEPFGVADLFRGRSTGNALLANLIYQAAVVAAGVFLVLPGFIAAGVGILTVPIALYQNKSPIGSLRASYVVLKEEWGNATLFVLLAALFSYSGGILFYIGVIFTTPILYLCAAILYADKFAVARPVPGITLDMPLPPPAAMESPHRGGGDI